MALEAEEAVVREAAWGSPTAALVVAAVEESQIAMEEKVATVFMAVVEVEAAAAVLVRYPPTGKALVAVVVAAVLITVFSRRERMAPTAK